ncbi:outer membrane protein [Rhizobium sp. CFBP 8762]|uniref:outer membrane protein n=1 Tax=Rhizobium sp. CFBP 8762 TaxID=2775279 RepID=UPI001FD26A31|nr:outer membrane protein [Rhizobium sp. CFBP 8762]
MRHTQHIGLALCAGLLAAGPLTSFMTKQASASDLMDAPEVQISQPADENGWYVRGDVGYSVHTSADAPSYSVNGVSGRFDGDRFSKPVSGSVGLGYQITDVWRADLTGDWFEGRFSGTINPGSPVRADYRAISLLANVYADLGTIMGVTPYVGAGLGSTNLRWDTVETAFGAYEGDQSWRLAFAMMTGFSYDLSEKTKLDLGYRYSRIAGGDMFAVNASDAGSLVGDDHSLSRHEIRAGLRFSF